MDGAARADGDETRWLSPPPRPPGPSGPTDPWLSPAARRPPVAPPGGSSVGSSGGPPTVWGTTPWPIGPRGAPPTPVDEAPDRGSIVGVVVLVVTLVAVVGASTWAARWTDTSPSATAVAAGGSPTTAVVSPTMPTPDTTGPPPTPTTGTTQPTTTTTIPPRRVREAPPLPAGPAGPYAFVETEADGEPATWDPCRPIRFVVNPRLAPPGAAEILAEATTVLGAATGLAFVDEGGTDEAPTDDRRRPYLQDRYGDDYAPVLISWTDETEVAAFAGTTNGQAYPVSIATADGEVVYVTGEVALDGDDAAARIAAGARETVLAVVIHELGHLLGLDHVDDPGEVMYGGGVVTPTLGPGDRAGLARLGRGQCTPALWR